MEKKRIRIAGIVIQDNKILMLKGIGYEELWTPGGKIDNDESDMECLKREFQEEIGVDIVKAEFYKEYDRLTSHYNPGQKLIERVYIVSIEGEPKPSAEIDNYLWFSKDDYHSKKYEMITHTQEDLIPGLIADNIW